MKIQIKNMYMLETAFKIVYFIFAFFTYCNLTFGKPIMSIAVDAVLALGAITGLCRLVKWKNYVKSPGLLFAVAYIISFVISFALNYQYGISDNFKGFVWMAFHFFLLFACDTTRDKKDYKKEFEIISFFYITVIFVLSLGGIIQFFAGYCLEEYIPDQPVRLAGMVWGRLWGMYYDPNYGSSFAMVAVIMSCYFFKNYKKIALRIFLALNIIVQFFYIAYSDSRTGLLTVFAGVFVYAYFSFIKKLKPKAILRSIVSVALSVVIASAVTVVPLGIKTVSNKIVTGINNSIENENNTPEDENNVAEKPLIGRESDLEGDISNRRFDIWKGGVEIFLAKPIAGVSFYNILSFTESQLPENYLVNNDHSKFSNMHNLFFNILSGQGVIGILVFFAFVIYMCVFILRRIFKINGEDYDYVLTMISCIAVALVASVFVTDIVFVNSPNSMVFWLFLGYVCHCLRKTDVKESTNEA